MQFPRLSDIKLSKLYIKKHHPEFFEYLLNEYSSYPYKKFTEILYCYYNNIIVHPTCPICGKLVPFLDFYRGYQKYCSLKCSNNSIDVKNKREMTNIDRFGYPSASQSEKIKTKIIDTTTNRYGGMGNASETIKTKQQSTMIDMYGSAHSLQNDELKNKSINTHINKYGGIGYGSMMIAEKIINTNINRYGVDIATKTESCKDKFKKTCLNRYGVEYPTQNNEIQNKIKNSKREQLINKYDNIISIDSYNDDIIYTIKCPHPNCNKCVDKYYKISSNHYWDRLNDNTEPCTNLLPVQKSNSKNTSLEMFIKNILDEYNITYIENDRSILQGKEIDIYIPFKKIGIECNGIYWHSLKPHKYHINKWLDCKKQGIQLLTIWQDWIINNPNIIRSIILSKLNIYKERIYARKCAVKEIGGDECNEFLNMNHIQGAGKSKIKLGLYYQDRLVSVMTFNNKMKCSGDNKRDDSYYELTRFCNVLNTQVMGGAGKLLKYFINHYNPSQIASFASNDISNGHLYESLGFSSDYKINNSYWYIDRLYKRYHRSTFTKAAIIKRGWAKKDEKWTEKDIMYKCGYFQIYDSGQTKYIYK